MNIVVLAGILITVVTAIPVLLQLSKQPKGLFILFFAEMWERFSYYGMRGLLILYLTQRFLFTQGEASDHYGAYVALVYLTPLLGGIVADRWLGTRKAVQFGAILLVIGHLGLAIEGPQARQVLTFASKSYTVDVSGHGSLRQAKIMVDGKGYAFGSSPDGGISVKGLPATSALPGVLPKGAYTLSVADRSPLFLNLFYLALGLIIMGVGFMKSNIASIVGQLYPQGDPRRDPGFTLYYYGINLGAFWAGILCGLLGESVGWWAGFGLAGLGLHAWPLLASGPRRVPRPPPSETPTRGAVERRVDNLRAGDLGGGRGLRPCGPQSPRAAHAPRLLHRHDGLPRPVHDLSVR
jgi:POT family proton-dependent oligopeptide transporter